MANPVRRTTSDASYPCPRWASSPSTTYGVLVATGVLLSLWYARVQAPRAGIWILTACGISAFNGPVGHRYRESVVRAERFGLLPRTSERDFWLVHLAIRRHLLRRGAGAIGFALVYMWVQKIPALPLFDTYAFALPLGHAIGRVGCFMAGCCYGKPTTLPWGVTFTSEAAERLVGTPLDIPLHPTQLYEAAVEFLNFLILIWLGRRQTFRGQIIGHLPVAVRCGARHHRVFPRRSRPHDDVPQLRLADAAGQRSPDLHRNRVVVARAKPSRPARSAAGLPRPLDLRFYGFTLLLFPVPFFPGFGKNGGRLDLPRVSLD